MNEREIVTDYVYTLEREIYAILANQINFDVRESTDVNLLKYISSGRVSNELAKQILDLFRPYQLIMNSQNRNGKKVIFIPTTFVNKDILNIDDINIHLKCSDTNLKLNKAEYKNLHFNCNLATILKINRANISVNTIPCIDKADDIKYILEGLLRGNISTTVKSLFELILKIVDIDYIENLVGSQDRSIEVIIEYLDIVFLIVYRMTECLKVNADEDLTKLKMQTLKAHLSHKSSEIKLDNTIVELKVIIDNVHSIINKIYNTLKQI